MLTPPQAYSTPPAIVEFATAACSRQTWIHPERRGHGAAQGNREILVVECERSESNTLRISKVSIYLQGSEGFADGAELNAAQAKACRPFQGVPCEVSAL